MVGETARVRFSTSGLGSLDEIRGIATRQLGARVDYGQALDFVLRFYREVEEREKERVLAVIRRELGPRLSFPARSV